MLGNRIEDVIDAIRAYVNMSKILINDTDSLNACTIMIRSIDKKWEIKRNNNSINPADNNDNDDECVNVTDIDNADPINNISENN